MATSQFKKGADYVKRSLREVQYQVLGMASALGLGGIGLSNLASRFIDVARETTRARVALRNISGDAAGFKENMDFLKNSADKYGQELNGMTMEFAKFSAAASSAGISLKDQHVIYDSFTRSIAAFGLTSSDAHLAYLALSQMMSKGKVSAEELRRQLGERMPVAMEAMARAVGVSIQELDKLIKAGKVVSKDVMLPFVKEMEKMLPEVNTDNIETSLNRLKNTFTSLTESLKVGEFYKKIIDLTRGLLSTLEQSFTRYITVIATSLVGGKLFNAFRKLRESVIKDNAAILANKIKTEEQAQLATQKRITAEANYNKLSELYAKASDDEKLRSYTKLTTAQKTMDKARLVEKKALLAQEEAAQKAAALRTQGFWVSAWTKIGGFVKGVMISIKGLFSSFLPMAIIGILTNFVMKLVEARKEAQRIKNIFNDNRASVFGVADTPEIQNLQTLHRIVKDRLGTQEEIKNAQDELQKKLGVEIKSQDDLNKKVAERISLLREAARAEQAAQNNAQLEQRNREIARKASKSGDSISFQQFLEDYRRVSAERGGDLRGATVIELAENRGLDTGGVFKNDFVNSIKEFEQNLRAINENNKILESSVRSGASITSTDTSTPPDDPDKKKETPLEKAEKKYTEELERLANQKAAGAIKEKEYNEAVDKLNKATYEEIAGILGVNAERNKTFQLAKKGVENQLSVTNELNDTIDGYNKSLKDLDEKKRLGLISDEKYNQELVSLIDSTSDKIASFEKVGEAEEEYINNLKQIKSGLIEKPTRESRDTTFDYKKSESDKLGEEVSLQEKLVRKLQEAKEQYELLGEYGKEALAEIAKEEEKLTSLSDALKLAELKEDIQQINKDLFSESIDGITGFANALDSVANSWERVANQDISGFERLVSIINAMGDTINMVVSAWESYQAIQELLLQLDKAREAQQAASTAAEVSKITAVSSAKIAADTAETASTTAKTAATVAALTAQEIAAKGVMAAQSTAAYAYIPFAGVGLAAGQIAAMQGLISATKAASAIPGFNDGGIVMGGMRVGDKNLIRANAGEVVMTTVQQGKLWKAIQSGDFGAKNTGVGAVPEIKLRIEGKDIVGSLKNYQQYLSRR